VRSIRTHQIIAFFMRYYSLYSATHPEGGTLDLTDPEHRILLDCLRDILRCVSAKEVIRRSVVEHHHHIGHHYCGSNTANIPNIIDPSTTQQQGFDWTSSGTRASYYMSRTTPDRPDEKYNLVVSNSRGDSPDISLMTTTTSTFEDAVTATYEDDLALLSLEARKAVNAIMRKIKSKVEEVCQRSFEEGRKVGRLEGELAMEACHKNDGARLITIQ